MATGATRLKVQGETAPAGYALVIVLGLITAFLLLIAFLNTVKTGSVVAESSMLFGALLFFANAATLYVGFGITGLDTYANFGSWIGIAGWISITAAVAHRWYASGHAPFASIYEMLLSFVWALALLTQIAERRFGIKLIGSITMPMAVTSVVLIQLLPAEVHPLVPALQSTWLHVHVTLAMLAYAACALSFALALMFLIKDKIENSTFLAVTTSLSSGIYAAVLFTRCTPSGGLSVGAWDLQNSKELIVAKGRPLFVVIPDLGWLFLLTFLVVASPLGILIAGRFRKRGSEIVAASRAVFVSILMQSLTLTAFLLLTRHATYPAGISGATYPTSTAASPFILSGAIASLLSSGLYVVLHWRRDDLERLLPPADILDHITYTVIAIAFPLLTLMIAAGAYWANRTWGSYWSWDPKETWAAITWLTYAGYLHMRIARGWRGRRAAYFAILGFAVVMFTFFGVTYLLPGLHAYA